MVRLRHDRAVLLLFPTSCKPDSGSTCPGAVLIKRGSQHRVSSFRLQDPTKSGHRRFIALWLVDPHRRVISTANVPPQQEAWSPGSTTGGSVANRTDEPVPRGLMTLEEAREHRLKLMDERTAEKARDHWERVEYNFCEH